MDSEPGGGQHGGQRLITFGSIGWLLLLVGILLLGVLLRLLLPAIKAARHPDAQDAFNGFDLNSLVPGIEREYLVRGSSRDVVPALSAPARAAPAEVPVLNKRGKYLVSNDRVIGLSINGESRAYPLSILNWHEAVNDELGGTAVLVTYSPLSDSAVVFSREIGGRSREFGVSGLLYQSNLLLYDQPDAGQESSLWSQLGLRAISGPAAQQGLKFEVLPSALMRWSDWLERFPETDVLSSETGYHKEYKGNPYQQYFAEERIRFPVERHAENEMQPGDFERYLLLQLDGEWKSYPLSAAAELAGAGGTFELDGLSFTYRGLSPQMDPPVLFALDAEGRPLPGITGLRFALEAAGRL